MTEQKAVDINKITRQLNFYFTDSNYSQDKYLLEKAQENDGWIPIDNFLIFNKIKQLTDDVNVLVDCFKNCEEVVVSEDNKNVKRKRPPVDAAVILGRSVFANGFSGQPDMTKVEEAFNAFGKVLSVWNIKHLFDKKKSVFVEFDNEDIAKEVIAKGTIKFNEEGGEVDIKIKPKKEYVDEMEARRAKFASKLDKKGKKRKFEEDGDKDGENDGEKEEKGNFQTGLLLRIKDATPILKEGEPFMEFKEYMKAALAEYGKVEYVELNDKKECIVRFAQEESSQNLLKAINEEKRQIRDKVLEGGAEIITGDEESEYWNTKIFNRSKKGGRGRGRGRGGRGGKRGGGRGRGGAKKRKLNND